MKPQNPAEMYFSGLRAQISPVESVEDSFKITPGFTPKWPGDGFLVFDREEFDKKYSPKFHFGFKYGLGRTISEDNFFRLPESEAIIRNKVLDISPNSCYVAIYVYPSMTRFETVQDYIKWVKPRHSYGYDIEKILDLGYRVILIPKT